MGGGTSDAFPMALRIQNAIVSYAAYLGRTIWPVGLAAFYPFPHEIPSWQIAASAAVMLAISIGVARTARSRPYALVGWLWYLGMLVPVIGVIQVGEQARADRYTYVPLVGIFIVVAWGVMELATRRRVADRLLWATGTLVVLALASASWMQAQTWHDSGALWTHAIAVTTDNDRAYNGLGAEVGNHGDLDRAIVDFREAIRINPTFADAYENLAVALSAEGKPAEALPDYAEAIRLQPGFVAAHNHYAAALTAVGRLDDAIREHHASLAIDPQQAGEEAELGIALEREGRFQEAIVAEETALRLHPTAAQAAEAHFGLGVADASLGRPADAIKEFNEVLRLDPGNPQARQALADLRRKMP
jgi:tetratricopeptide (TPR) repeat protein